MRQRLLEEAGERFVEPRVRIALVRHELVQHRERRRRTSRSGLVRYSSAPASVGECSNAVCSVSARPISTSGFSPGSRRRIVFRMNRSSKTIDVLVCSPRSTCTGRSAFAASRQRSRRARARRRRRRAQLGSDAPAAARASQERAVRSPGSQCASTSIPASPVAAFARSRARRPGGPRSTVRRPRRGRRRRGARTSRARRRGTRRGRTRVAAGRGGGSSSSSLHRNGSGSSATSPMRADVTRRPLAPNQRRPRSRRGSTASSRPRWSRSNSESHSPGAISVGSTGCSAVPGSTGVGSSASQ